MRIEALEGALTARPFRPFRIVLPSDRSLAVPHPEFVSIAPTRRWVLVWNKKGAWNIIEPAMVVELSFSGVRRQRGES